MKTTFFIFYIISAINLIESQFLSPFPASIEPVLINCDLRNLDLTVSWEFPFQVYHDGFYLEAKFARDKFSRKQDPNLQLSFNTDNDEFKKIFFLRSMHLQKCNYAFVRACSVYERQNEVQRNCTKSIRYPISKEAIRDSHSGYRLLRTTTNPKDVSLTIYSSQGNREIDATIICIGEGKYNGKLGKREMEGLEWRTVIGSEERLSLSGLRPNTVYKCEILGRESESIQIVDIILTDIEFKTGKIDVPSPPEPRLNTHVTSLTSLRDKLSIFLQPAEMQEEIGKYILIAYPVDPIDKVDGTNPSVTEVTSESLNSQIDAISSKEAIPFIVRTFLSPELPLMHSFAGTNTAGFKLNNCYYFVLVSVSRKQVDALGWNSTVECILLGGQSRTKIQKFLRYGAFAGASSVVCFCCLFTVVCLKSIATIKKKIGTIGGKKKYTKVRSIIPPNTPSRGDPVYDYIPPPPPDEDDY